MSKFDIMLYLVLNLISCITFVRFNAKFNIALGKIFYIKMLNFDIAYQFGMALEMLLRLTQTFTSQGNSKPNRFETNLRIYNPNQTWKHKFKTNMLFLNIISKLNCTPI